MGIVFRQSIKTTIIALTGTMLGAALQFILPKYLSKEALGFSRNIINQGAVAQFIVLLGVHSVIITFIPRYKPKSVQRKVLLALGFIVPLAVSLLLCIPYFLLRDWAVGHYQVQDRALIYRYYALLPFLTLAWSYMSLMDSYLATQMKIAVSAFAREVLLRVFSFLLLILFATGRMTFDGFMIGSVLIHLIPVAVMIAIALRTKDFGFSLKWHAISRPEWKQAIHFGWYHLLAGAAFQLIGFMDSLMLAPLDRQGMASVAVYTIAVFIASFIAIPYRAMVASVAPVLNRAYIDKDMPRLHDFFHRSGINVTIAGIAMFVLVACNLQNMISLLPAGKGYEAAATLALILMIGRLADIFTGLNSELLSISSHYKFLFRISAVLLVMFVVLNRILIPRYSFYGAAWSATLSLLFFNVAKAVFVYRKFGLSPFSKNTLRAFLAGGLAAIAGYFLPHVGNAFTDMPVRSAAIIFVYGLSTFFLRPAEDLVAYFHSVRSKKRLF